MSELKMKPEFGAASDGDAGTSVAARAEVVVTGAARKGMPLHGSRRRYGSTSLRAPSDDGFHLFRVY